MVRLPRLASLRRHVSDLLSGLYSLGGRPDRAIVQQRLRTHPALERISYRGTPDVRVLVYRGEPAMAMLRLPTLESNGRANLHQGGVGVGVEVETGRTTRAIWRSRVVDRHPDTGETLAGRTRARLARDSGRRENGRPGNWPRLRRRRCGAR